MHKCGCSLTARDRGCGLGRGSGTERELAGCHGRVCHGIATRHEKPSNAQSTRHSRLEKMVIAVMIYRSAEPWVSLCVGHLGSLGEQGLHHLRQEVRLRVQRGHRFIEVSDRCEVDITLPGRPCAGWSGWRFWLGLLIARNLSSRLVVHTSGSS